MRARKPTRAEWEREAILRERWMDGELSNADPEMAEWQALQDLIRRWGQ
jgi:hypothetical protein